MLIRSQDRTSLFNVEKVGLISVVSAHDGDDEYIVGLAPDANEAWLVKAGAYSTEAKALKVMDEIADMYVEEAKRSTLIVFNMPQDWEDEPQDLDAEAE